MEIHGHCARGQISSESRAFSNAKQRCTNPKNPSFKNYGGRGIRFRFASFLEFLSIVGRKPFPDLTLDRIRNNGHYEPGNVRWTTQSGQMLNTRGTMKRKTTNEDVLKGLLKKRGHIALSLTIRVKDPDTGQYGHYKGGSVNVQAGNVPDATALCEAVKMFTIKKAREMGMKLPGLVVVDA